MAVDGERRFTGLVEELLRDGARRMAPHAAADAVGETVARAPARLVAEAPSEEGARRLAALAGGAHARGSGQAIAVAPLFPGAPADEYGLDAFWLVTPPLSRGEAGAAGEDLAAALRDVDGVADAFYEDVYTEFDPARREGAGSPGASGEEAGERSFLDRVPRAEDVRPGDPGAPPWADRRWALRATRTDRVHAKDVLGRGVVIAHPDTGWRTHRELDLARLDLERDANLMPGEATSCAFDPLNRGPKDQPGHGTGTGSVAVSGHGAGDVFGAAPEATLLPIRCVDSVVLITSVNLAMALWHAIREGAHVASISLGGLPSRPLERVVKKAVYDAQMIVCAAAGNVVPTTVFPARYAEVVAVAASTASDRPWKLSSSGRSVDVSAPGARVWAADFDDDRAEIVIAGEGTSYATPQVAAAAALWLEHRGRDRLIAHYGGRPALQQVFRHLVRATARDPTPFPHEPDRDGSKERVKRWNRKAYGAGILDAERLVGAALPSREELEGGRR